MLIKDKTAIGKLSDAQIREIELLLQQETELLDACRYDDWLSLFSEDCLYWVPAVIDQTDAENHISLFYEDRTLMSMRVERLRHPQAHSLIDPVRSARVVSNPVLETFDVTTGNTIISTRFIMTEYYRNEQRIFNGTYHYELEKTKAGYQIKLKRVNLINCDAILESIQIFI